MPAPLSAAVWDRLTGRVITARGLPAPALAGWWREVARSEPELMPWLLELLVGPEAGGAAQDRPTPDDKGAEADGRF